MERMEEGTRKEVNLQLIGTLTEARKWLKKLYIKLDRQPYPVAADDAEMKHRPVWLHNQHNHDMEVKCRAPN